MKNIDSIKIWMDPLAWWQDFTSPFTVGLLRSAADADEDFGDGEAVEQIKKKLENEFGNNPILVINDQDWVNHYYRVTEKPEGIFSTNGHRLIDQGFTL